MNTASATEHPLSPVTDPAASRRDDVAIGPAQPVMPGEDPALAADALVPAWLERAATGRGSTPAAAEPTAVVAGRRPAPVMEIVEGDFHEEETLVPAALAAREARAAGRATPAVTTPALAMPEVSAPQAAPVPVDPSSDVALRYAHEHLAARRRRIAFTFALLGMLAGVASALLR